MDDSGLAHDEEQGVGRTPADATTLLIELGRTLKGWQFYPEGHPARGELLDRCWRAWHADLERGVLELEARRGGLWLAGADVALGHGRLDDLARAFVVRAVRRMRFGPELDPPSLGAFLDVLSTDPEALEAAGGFEAAYYTAPRRGVSVNEADYSALERERVPADEAAQDGEPEGEPADSATADGDPLVAFVAANPALVAPQEAEAPPAPEPDAPDELETDAPAEQLAELLDELDEYEDGPRYRDLVVQAATLAQQCAESGDLDAPFAALRLLVAHAGDDAKRSHTQREVAQDHLERLAAGEILGDVIERACAPDTDTSLRATEVLLQLGPRAVAPLLVRLAAEHEGGRRARLSGALIAMGDDAVPALAEAMVDAADPCQRVALRLAGETQNPQLVPGLRRVLLEDEDEALREAARALVRVGDVAALEALVEALRSPRADVAALAAYSLGATGRALCVGPLVEVLARALKSDELALAREVLRGLGRLGRPEGVPALASVLSRGGLFQRRRLRDLKLTAISALAQIPGADAEETLGRATRSGDRRLRDAAEAALSRRVKQAAAGETADAA